MWCPTTNMAGGIRLSQEEFVARVKAAQGDTISFVGAYKNGQSPIDVRCNKCLREWKSPARYLIVGQGCQCNRGRQSLSQYEFLARVQEVHRDRISVLGEYRGWTKKVGVVCSKCDRQWNVLPGSLLAGHGCGCGARRVNKLSHEEFLKRTQHAHLNHISILGTYQGRSKRILARCNKCDTQWSPPAGNLIDGYGCPRCAGRQRRSHQQFELDIGRIHAGKIVVVGEYASAMKKIEVRCVVCSHTWNPIADSLLRGVGCPECAISGFQRNKSAICYYARIFNACGSPVYKIGVTNRTVAERFKGELDKLLVLNIKHFTTGADAYAVEREILRKYRADRYCGPRLLRGAANDELFTRDVLGLDTGDTQLSFL